MSADLTTATTTSTGDGRVPLGTAAAHAGIIARRNLLHIRSDPDQLTGMTIQPIMFLLLFVYVFGGAIAGSSREYRQFALPGLIVQSVCFTAMQTAMSLNADFQRGLIDRFRSLPIARSAVVAGRVMADSVRVMWGTLLMIAFAMLLGFRFGGGALGGLASLALVLGIGVALCWPMAYLGAKMRTPEAVQQIGFLTVMPLTFASSVFARPDSMPRWLEAFVNVNPVTAMVDATRALMLGGPVTDALVEALAWIVGITVVFAPLAVRAYRRRI
jgi:ABC transporter DrrB family efflux protein